MTTYEFNIHIMNAHHVEVESDAPLHDVVADLMDGFLSDELELGEPSVERIEFWNVTDGECYEVAHGDCWGRYSIHVAEEE